MYEVVPGAMPREMGELEQTTSEDGHMNDRSLLLLRTLVCANQLGK